MSQAAKATGDLERQGLAVQRAGRAMSSFGAEMTRSVTLPIVAVGAAAVKMSMDFDQAFAQMQGLAGVSADEIDGLKESVMGLAGETGRAPQELAEALYFIRSSGLEGQRALEALEVSAKAAASGLGTTEVVADAVTSAMNAYAESGMTAARATDVLVATAREGKAEPAELAAQMGRLLPVASQLGISFEDVGAAVATLSLNGNDAATSSTQLSNVMSKMLKPSQQGAEALDAVGLSVEALQEMIADRGLLGTLEELRARLGESGYIKFLEDQQAVQGGLALLGGDLEATRDRFDALADSAGASADAFDQTDSGARDMQKAWAQVQVALIQVGQIIAPLAADIATLIASVVSVFGHLPGPVQTAVVAFLGLAAAVGPVAWAIGKVMTVWGTLMPLFAASGPITRAARALDQFTVSGVGVSSAMGKLPAVARAAATAVAGLAVAFAGLEFINSLRVGRVADELEGLTEGVDTSTLDGVRESLAAYRDELDELDEREGKGRLFSVGGANVFATGGDADRQERIDQLREKIEELEASEESLQDQERDLAASYAGTAGAADDLTDSTVEAISALQDYADEIKAQFDPMFAMLDALRDNADAQAEVTAAQQALNDAVSAYGEGSPEATEAQQALTAAQREATGSALDVTQAVAQLNAAIEANPALLESSKSQLATWVAQGLISEETAAAMGAQFDITALKAVALGQTDPNVSVTATDRATPTIASVEGAVRNLDGKRATVNIDIFERVFGHGSPFGFNAEPRALGGPVRANSMYEVVEGGRPELLQQGNRTYLMPGQDGTVVPMGQMTSAGNGGGGWGGGLTQVRLTVTGDGGLYTLMQRGVREGQVQLEVDGKRVQVR
jgi:TP901 family phage tail tape measure protein